MRPIVFMVCEHEYMNIHPPPPPIIASRNGPVVRNVGTTSCNKSVELNNNLVASFQQAVDNLSTSWEQAMRTHPVDKLLEQHCYKSAASLLQFVRFYVCSFHQNRCCNIQYVDSITRGFTVVPIEAFRKMLTNSFPNLKEHL